MQNPLYRYVSDMRPARSTNPSMMIKHQCILTHQSYLKKKTKEVEVPENINRIDFVMNGLWQGAWRSEDARTSLLPSLDRNSWENSPLRESQFARVREPHKEDYLATNQVTFQELIYI